MLGDLLAARPLVEPGILTCLIDAILAERQRIHAVVGGGGVQTDEWIGIHPMTPGCLSRVDHRHLNVRLGHQRVSEGKTPCARPYNQIIGIDEHLNSSWLWAESPVHLFDQNENSRELSDRER